MSYSIVDPVIADWARVHGLTVLTHFGDNERRFSYISGADAESFQISIEPPENGEVTINAWDVETRDDEDLHRQWTCSVAELRPTLEAAFEQVSQWTHGNR